MRADSYPAISLLHPRETNERGIIREAVIVERERQGCRDRQNLAKLVPKVVAIRPCLDDQPGRSEE